MVKGEIWWAKLPARPVLVIQSDSFNRSSLNTVICAIITSNTNLSGAPANILLEKAESKLEKTSVITFSQIIALDKAFLTRIVSMLPKHLIHRVDQSIKLVFDID